MTKHEKLLKEVIALARQAEKTPPPVDANDYTIGYYDGQVATAKLLAETFEKMIHAGKVTE